MITIKVQCGCGQRYAFDVEAVNNRMPSPVACPVCGADGTAAANTMIAGSMPQPPPVVAAPPSGVRLQTATPGPTPAPALAAPRITAAAPALVSAPPSASRRPVTIPGQVDRTQAEHTARAKITWGDSQQEVIGYLRIQGFTPQEATAFVQDLLKERAATIRKNGIKKIFIGAGLICLPVLVAIAMLVTGFFSPQLLALPIIAGIYGIYLVLKGIIMTISPKSEAGDVWAQ